MPELNKANRQVADVDIRVLSTMMPFLFFDTANTTTAGLTSDSVYAKAKGANRIGFQNPLEGTMTIEAQVVPFKFYALLSDGTIKSSGLTAIKETVEAKTGGKLTLTLSDGATIQPGTFFVYPVGEFGNEEKLIKGTLAGSVFTATTSSEIAANTKYEIGAVISRTKGVKTVSFNNKALPKDYFITMNTVDKDEEGNLAPFIMTAYKASVQRNLELSFSSEGDPASMTMTFNLFEDKDGNVLDLTEITDPLSITVA